MPAGYVNAAWTETGTNTRYTDDQIITPGDNLVFVPDPQPRCWVTFETNGGSIMEMVAVISGETDDEAPLLFSYGESGQSGSSGNSLASVPMIV